MAGWDDPEVGGGYAVLIRMLQYYNQWKLDDEIANLRWASAEAGADALGIAALPFLMLDGYVRAIDWAYEEARKAIQNENTASGLSQGLIMGLLGWKWHQVTDLFARSAILPIYQRPDLNAVWANAYNLGLRMGYHQAAQFDVDVRKGYLLQCRKISGARAARWERNDQISYVIALAAAFRKTFMNW
jgi:hypothetical protein